MNTLLITNPILESKNYICQQLQSAWNTLCSNDKRIKEINLLQESEYFKIIDNLEKLENIDKKFIPEAIYIVPELMWANDDVNEGYDVARELITKIYKSEFIQIVFLSVLDRATLKEIVDVRNKSLVEAFPHMCLLDNKVNLNFEYYSKIHYKLLKHLAVSNEGRLQKISHEMNSVKANILRKSRDAYSNRTDLIAKLEELSLFQQLTETSITQKISEIKEINDNDLLSNELNSVENIIDEISIKILRDIENVDTSIKYKSNYKVFIIEDEPDYRKFFYETFSKFYTEVYPNQKNEYPSNLKLQYFDLSNAEELIKHTGKDFNIFLLDLLYKNKDGWLTFNGLDLYKRIREVNPYAVIRIITSLPRGIVAKLVEVILNDTEKPNTDQVFTKKYGFDFLKDSIIESIVKINEECRLRAKTKTVLSPFPKTGIFKWTGIPELMFSLLNDKKDHYFKHHTISQGFYNQYLKGTLDKSTIGWKNGELPKPGMKSKITDSYFLGKFSSIMTHRLIVLNEALKNNDFVVHYSDYLEIIENITNITQLDKGYFQTKLGFSGTEIKENENSVGFKIALENLFPEEIIFITETLSAKDKEIKNSLLREINSELNEFFKRVLGELITYESWDELKLGYDPYQTQKKSIDEGSPISTNSLPDLTLKQLINFLQALIDNYDKEFIAEIALLVTEYEPGKNKIKNRPVEILIDNLFLK